MIVRIKALVISKITLGIVVVSVLLGGATIVKAQAIIASNSSLHSGYNNSSNTEYYEIDFTYSNIINGKSYPEEATLLKDKQWLEENNIHQAGDTLVLNIPEFGVVDARATARSIEVSDANPEEVYTNKQSMVTGTFKHYSIDVREYTLKDSKTGITQTIDVTPNHSFYVQNRTAFNKALKQNSHFIEIQDITPEDHMLNEAGNSVELVCKQTNTSEASNNGNTTNCYKQLVNNNKPIAVYNLEIYKQHQYMVLSNNSAREDKEQRNNVDNDDTNNRAVVDSSHSSSPLAIAINNAVLVHNICADVAGGTGGGDDPNFNRPVDPQARIGSDLEETPEERKRRIKRESAARSRAKIKAADPEGFAASKRESNARYSAKIKAADPEAFAAYHREANARYSAKIKAADPEGFAAYKREINARYSAKIKAADPEAFAAYKRESVARSRAKIKAADPYAIEGGLGAPYAPPPIANPIADFDAFFDNALAGNLAALGTDPIVPLLPEPALPPFDLGDLYPWDFN